MTDTSAVQALLTDSFERVRELVGTLTGDLSLEDSTYRPDADANSIGWLLWHLTRIQDDHVADLAGAEQVWRAWRDRFDLPFNPLDTGYGHGIAEVAAVRVESDLLAGYHGDVHAETLRYLETVTPAELERVVDERWDPPVTAGVRLVSVIGDCLQHLGQASYVLGIAQRAAAGR
jgi:hypothetical protein